MSSKSEENKKPIFRIGIISGKGGVGKTTLSASLALLFNKNNFQILAMDCDVDAPNLGLLFKSGKIMDNFDVKTLEIAKFNQESCTSCRKCVDEEFCKFGALSWDDQSNYPLIDEIACEGCGACEKLCPEHSFHLELITSGTISYEASEYGFPLIWGETVLGASTSGKLITEIKKYSETIVKDLDIDLIVIDGPPGIGCPVIATISDLDFVIVVIEPTQTGLHDADRAIGVLKQLQRKFAIVINKADAWDEGYNNIVEYAKKAGINIIGKIPVDNSIPNSTVKGIPVILFDENAPASNAIKDIYKKVLNLIPEQIKNKVKNKK
ncbi:MAG: P-loop NTPase [Promethearchaeota archaeon]